LGSFGQTWNRRHQRHGHGFQGRYTSKPATGEQAADPLQFRVPIDAAMGHNRSVGRLIRQGDRHNVTAMLKSENHVHRMKLLKLRLGPSRERQTRA
jgi:hypothetical protein